MTALRLRQWLLETVPIALRYSFAVGLGLFLTFIGLNESGLVKLAVPGAPVQAGNLSARAGFLDQNGHLPQIERPMMVDAVATTLAPMLGTSISGAYVESATGIGAGGRTGLTVFVTGICFLLALFFAPFVTAIPAHAYGPALIIVGLFMLAPITRIDFGDYSESIPAFAVVVLMVFTYNTAIGICAGFVLYPICKLVAGNYRQLKSGLWVLAAISLVFLVFYPSC